MKKIVFVLVFIMSVVYLNAQNSKVVSAYNYLKPQYNELGKAKEAIDLATKHEKTKLKAKTWYYRGLVYHAIFQTKDTAFQKLCENPLKIAKDAFIKAIELDTKEKYKKDITSRLQIAGVQFLNKGISEFNSKDNEYEKAFESFQNAVKINELPFIAQIDTMSIFYSAVAADRAKLYDTAIKYYKECTEYKFNGSKVYLYIENIYKEQKDTVNALKILKEGIAAYPDDNNSLMIELINFYLTSNQSAEALKYLQKAIEKDPSNFSFYFAEGTLYDKLDDFDNAVKAYSKSIEIKPDYFNAQYNLGALYYNNAVKLIDSANAESDNKKYEIKKAAADKIFEKAIPYLEKAHEIDSKDMSTMESLKTLYYRMQFMVKFNAIKEEINNITIE
ncbi:MAG: tetratricopeptide repeat protein [Bacteroidetes bacterium]|nr:tetratricopeptide repeat protein [Bacteroidota bacterium]